MNSNQEMQTNKRKEAVEAVGDEEEPAACITKEPATNTERERDGNTASERDGEREHGAENAACGSSCSCQCIIIRRRFLCWPIRRMASGKKISSLQLQNNAGVH